MRRPGWATAAAIYNWIAGGFGILIGIAIAVLSAFLGDLLSGMMRALGAQGVGITLVPGILMGLTILLISILQIVYGVGLWRLRRWAWVTAIATHIVMAVFQLVMVITLIASGLAGLGLLQTFFMAINILFAVGLLLRSTAAAYAPGATPAPMAMPGGLHLEANFAIGQGGPAMSAGGPAIGQGGPAMGAGGPAIGPSASIPPTQAGLRASAPPASAPRFGVARTEVASPEPEVMAWIVERTGTRVGREHRLKQQVTLGRDPARCEIVLDDSKVSGEHARIRLENGQFVLYDLASTNHTYVNGQEIQKQALRDGDRIKIGPNSELSFMHIGT